jgi:uncharacterized protein YegL
MGMNEFVQSGGRPLPLILLLDVSGSMGQENKINDLNRAVKEMIKEFSKEESTIVEIQVAIITFGQEVKLHTNLIPASKIQWQDMSANGQTPLGSALELAKALIEDKTKITGRSYRPTVILVSDGSPYGESRGFWQEKMNEFINDGRSKKCDRFAMALGSSADVKMLESFVKDPEKKLFKAADASQIINFFRYVTMSRINMAKSSNPNENPDSDKNLQDLVYSTTRMDKEVDGISGLDLF